MASKLAEMRVLFAKLSKSRLISVLEELPNPRGELLKLSSSVIREKKSPTRSIASEALCRKNVVNYYH